MAPLILAALKIAAGFAPQLLESAAGPEVAGKVVEIAQAVTGGSTPDSALSALQADPAKALEFQQALLAADADIRKAEFADIASARSMQVAALAQDDVFSKRFVYYFAAAWSLFTMLYFSFVTFVPLAPAGQRVADTILGVLITTVLGSMIAYFYGSTKGSAEKTRLLAASTPK